MQTDPARIHAGTQHHRQLAAGAHVDAQPFLDDPTRDCGAQKRLGGVVDVPAVKRGRESAGPGPQVRLVHDINRGADLVGDLTHRDPGNDELPVSVLADSRTPQLGQQVVHVIRD